MKKYKLCDHLNEQLFRPICGYFEDFCRSVSRHKYSAAGRAIFGGILYLGDIKNTLIPIACGYYLVAAASTNYK
jgi:hypothetical protein